MATYSSPMHLVPPLTPRRAPSPTMTPGGRRVRTYRSSEEGQLRDLSPETTLYAFTQQPMPFDTTRDEYKIFSCIESLTAAERDLGARVAKAAQRLKSWCSEIEQWGWSGSFEQPSKEYREQRRRSIELRIREHVAEADLAEALPPLEYWGSLLSVEVEQHEARLDDIEDDMLKLDVEELKEHVLDMHPAGGSRPSSAGFGGSRQNYKPMDDFSFLITQTLLSALPHHARLKERMYSWTARVSILREAPKFVNDLDTAQKALRLGWDAIEPPADNADLAFAQWKEAVETISGVLRTKVGDLGRRLDRMLDTLEGREDCLPERWIDVFEDIEADYGRWAHESRRRVMEQGLRRRVDKGSEAPTKHVAERLEPHSDHVAPTSQQPTLGASSTPNEAIGAQLRSKPATLANPSTNIDIFRRKTSGPLTTFGTDVPDIPTHFLRSATDVPGYDDKNAAGLPDHKHANTTQTDPSNISLPGLELGYDSKHTQELPRGGTVNFSNAEPWKITASRLGASAISDDISEPVMGVLPMKPTPEADSPYLDEESEFEEGDTVVHNEFEDDPEPVAHTQPSLENSSDGQDKVQEKTNGVIRARPKPLALADSPIIITNDGPHIAVSEPSQTPSSRRCSVDSFSSEMSFDSSPPSNIEESPSVRNANNRAVRPRPELNAAMGKRRIGKSAADDSVESAPWPPTRFTQKPANSTDDLERKISDILTTIPAHIRLTSGPGPDAPEVKSARGLVAKGSRGYLRATRTASGIKSPELTLSPAKSEFELSSSSLGRKSAANRGDNDIKLYHLTQPGKELPIKLFIRRVGENGERVMVRVGGGWADLGEYLRQYAEHHGRRTVSDANFEVLGMEIKNPDSSPRRPDTATSKGTRRFSGGHVTVSPATTPVKSPGVGISKEEPCPPMPNFVSTPGIAEESVPSTKSSAHSWRGKEVGLAGPKAKKLDLSGQKLEWIEGMMKQARTVSSSVLTADQPQFGREEPADSRGESRPESRAGNRSGAKRQEFGDLGKVGGTQRVFFKGGKPPGNEQ